MNPETGIKDVANNASLNGLDLYPNPVCDILTINSTQKTVAEIFDTTGRLMISRIVEGSNNKINVQQLAKGIYIVKLNSKDSEISRKIIKE